MNNLSFKDLSFCVDSRYPGIYVWFTIFNKPYHFSLGGIQVNPELRYPHLLLSKWGIALVYSFDKALVWGEDYGSI
jgi:hypothetical protein